MKHSPLPWRNVGSSQVADANGMFAASAIISPNALTGAREADERVDLIVRSVNALPDLVSALGAAEGYISVDTDIPAADAVLAIIRAALQKASKP